MHAQQKSAYRLFIKIALPNILVSVMSPLIEIIDLMIVGNSGHVACMAGIGIAISILNIVTWFFGNHISAYTSQAVKMQDRKRRSLVLIHSILIASFIGILFICSKSMLWTLLINFFKIEEIVKIRGKIYYDIVSWSMPFILINHAIIGWLIGLSRIKRALILQVSMNILNLILNIVFVRGLNVDLEAVAVTTVLIHLFVALSGIYFISKDLKSPLRDYFIEKPFYFFKFIKENKDLMIQSSCAILINMIVSISSSYLGSNVLAANIVLLQIQSLFAYLFNGFSSTIADFTNMGVITRNTDLLRSIEEACMTIIMYTVIFFTLLYRLYHNIIIEWFTNIEVVKEVINLYDGWLAMYIIMASWGLGLQGIFRGRNQDKLITQVNLIGLSVFLCLFKFLMTQLGNHGIWLAVIVFQFIRSLLLMALGGKR